MVVQHGGVITGLFISNKVWDSQLVKADMNSRQSDHLAWEYINL